MKVKRFKVVLSLVMSLVIVFSATPVFASVTPSPQFGEIVYETDSVVIHLGNPDDPTAKISADAVSMYQGISPLSTMHRQSWRTSNGRATIHIPSPGGNNVRMSVRIEGGSNPVGMWWLYRSNGTRVLVNGGNVFSFGRGAPLYFSNLPISNAGSGNLRFEFNLADGASASNGVRLNVWVW